MRLPERFQRPVAILAPLAYLAAIFVQSSFELPPQPEALPDNIDKVLHLLEYGILGFLLQRGIAVGLRKPEWTFWVAAAAGAIYGCTDELHQLFVPGRSASWGDVAADVVGSLAGAWLGARRTRPSGTAFPGRAAPEG
jgi:VanZ family protein